VDITGFSRGLKHVKRDTELPRQSKTEVVIR